MESMISFVPFYLLIGFVVKELDVLSLWLFLLRSADNLEGDSAISLGIESVQ